MARELERLIAPAIERGGTVHRGRERGAHWEIRAQLGDEEPNRPRPGDVEGFVTSEGHFLNRRAANEIAAAAGQCVRMARPMLSSDIDWTPHHPARSSAQGYSAPPPAPRRRFRP